MAVSKVLLLVSKSSLSGSKHSSKTENSIDEVYTTLSYKSSPRYANQVPEANTLATSECVAPLKSAHIVLR